MNEKTTVVDTSVLANTSQADEDSQRQDSGRAVQMSSSETIVRRRLKPSRQWTAHQIFYVFILDGIGGMALSAGVNFALAYGTFRHYPLSLTLASFMSGEDLKCL